MRLLDSRFKYSNSASTNVRSTWERFGFRPTTDEERQAAQHNLHAPERPPADVTPLNGAKHKAAVPALRLTVKKGS